MLEVTQDMECAEIKQALDVARKYHIPLHFREMSVALGMASEFFHLFPTFKHVIVCTGSTRDEWSLFRNESEKDEPVITSVTSFHGDATINDLHVPFQVANEHNLQLETKDNKHVFQMARNNADKMLHILREQKLTKEDVPLIASLGGKLSDAIYQSVEDSIESKELKEFTWECHERISSWIIRMHYFGDFVPLCSSPAGILQSPINRFDWYFKYMGWHAKKEKLLIVCHVDAYPDHLNMYVYNQTDATYDLEKEPDLTQAISHALSNGFIPVMTIASDNTLDLTNEGVSKQEPIHEVIEVDLATQEDTSEVTTVHVEPRSPSHRDGYDRIDYNSVVHEGIADELGQATIEEPIHEVMEMTIASDTIHMEQE